MLPWKLRKRHILPVNQNLSSVYFSLAKFQLVSFTLSRTMIWQMTYTQTAKTLFNHLKRPPLLGDRGHLLAISVRGSQWG